MATYPKLAYHIDRPMAIGLVLLLVLALLPAAVPQVQAGELVGSVNFDERVYRLSYDNKSVFPSVAVDRNGRTHVVYLDFDSAALYYTNNVNGSFFAAQRIESGVGEQAEPSIAFGPDGILHLVYSRNAGSLAYRRGTLNGASISWAGRETISGSGKTYGGDVAIDGAGNAHIVWIDRRCGQYNVHYRVRFADGNLSGTSEPRDRCGDYQTSPQITVTSSGTPHVVFQNETDIYYARLTGNGWVNQNISNSRGSNSANPSITSDGNQGVFAAWGEGANNHDVVFKVSKDGGANWSSTISISKGSSYAEFPTVTWSPEARRVYIIWSDTNDSDDNRTDIWFREYDPDTNITGAADRIAKQNGDSNLPDVNVGGPRVDIVWQDKRTGELQVNASGGTIVGRACTGTLSLENGAAATRNTSITGQITTSNCTPTRMQVSVDTPITDSTPIVAYQQTFTANITDTDECNHTVYVRLFVDNNAGEPFSDTIVVDNKVDAYLNIVNPYMINNQPQYSEPDSGARDGDAGYSRNRYVLVDVQDIGDCTGLTSFTIPGNGGSQAFTGTFRDYKLLPGDGTAGTKTFQVQVQDALGNVQNFPNATQQFGIVYDTLRPVIDMAANPTVVVTNTTDSALVNVTVNNLSVTDNLYGQRENLVEGRQYWGLWVATSRTLTATADTLTWSTVPVRVRGSSISFEWSLLSGLGLSNPSNGAGDYYVFVRALDGAGNPSREADILKSGRITLKAGYSLPRLLLPSIDKNSSAIN